jgi:NitT/TauT family transport system substrate-binding protein
MKRGAFIAAGTAVVVAGPAYADAQAMTKLRIVGTPDDDLIGVIWGVQSGIFPRLGLEVEFTRGNSGSAVIAALLGGSLEIGKSSTLGLITAHAKGIPVVIESPAAIHDGSAPTTAALVVAKNSPFRTARDLNGSTIAVPALNDLFTIINCSWIDQNGGDSRTVKFLELPSPAAADAIAAGRVAAATLAEPILSSAVTSGKVRIFAHSLDAIARRFIATSYFTTAEYAAKNADVMARFRKGLAQSLAYAIAHRSEMFPYVAKYTGIDVAEVATMPQTVLGTPAQLDPRLLQPMIDAAVKYKVIPATFPAKDMIDPAALS